MRNSNNYAKTLESYLIPANEALSTETKDALVSIGVSAAIFAALGISQKLKDRKAKKDQLAKNKANNETREKALKEAFAKVDQKYKLSSMTKDEYKKFIAKMEDQLEIDVRKILKPLNSKELLNKLKEDYINDYKDYYKDDPKKLESEIAYAEREFRPGLFKIYENAGQDICIVGSDQDISMTCMGVVSDVAEALELKYSDFVDAGLFSVGTGDGDEGCIYPEFVSYETMRKRI